MTPAPKTQRSATILLNKLGKERAELCGKIGRLSPTCAAVPPMEAKAAALLDEMKALQVYGAAQGWTLYHPQLFTVLNRSR